MIKRKLVILTGALSLYAYGITNLALPTYVIDKVEKEKLSSEPNVLGGVKNVSDWFALMPSPLDFDVDKNGSIDATEHYAYTKKVRWLFFNSPFMIDGDADNSGYTDSQEWDAQVAKVRVNGEWVAVFDTDQSGKMDVKEELTATKHMKDIYEYYGSVVQHAALAWGNTVDPDVIQAKYMGEDWQMDGPEISRYLNDNKAAFVFYYDWNADGEVTGIEAETASSVVQRTFSQINDYLLKMKSAKYSDFL